MSDMGMQSGPKRYVLLYGDVELGEVTQLDSDFPNCFGNWCPYTYADNPEVRGRVQAYIEFSEHADSLMKNFDITPAWEVYTLEREPEFEDLIESMDWAFRDEDGVRHPLLIPRFCVGGKMIWCWNFGHAV